MNFSVILYSKIYGLKGFSNGHKGILLKLSVQQLYAHNFNIFCTRMYATN